MAKNLHIAMYPWFAMGHIAPFLQLANNLAQMGHKVTMFLPPKTMLKLATLNRHPDLIAFVPISVPGRPETTHDEPGSDLMGSRDLTRGALEDHLARLRPDVVLFDWAPWVPGLARKHGVRSVSLVTVPLAVAAYLPVPTWRLPAGRPGPDLTRPPPGFPGRDGFGLAAHEVRAMAPVAGPIVEATNAEFAECDAIAFKGCKELEGAFCEFVAKYVDKPMFLVGPLVPEVMSSSLDEDIDGWLNRFAHRSVVYCALGSECVLEKQQFHELVLGLESTGRPFIAALKPPRAYQTLESALPEGFLERIKDRGTILEWVQQSLILRHPSVGCFVTHCGAMSVTEALMSECQIVLLPQAFDQFINARFMSLYLKVGVEVEKGEDDGFFTSRAVREAVDRVMEEGSEVGEEVRANHEKWRRVLSKEGLQESYDTQFVEGLRGLLV